jgi:hypothetical protein
MQGIPRRVDAYETAEENSYNVNTETRRWTPFWAFQPVLILTTSS